jgi:hypothetical protein
MGRLVDGRLIGKNLERSDPDRIGVLLVFQTFPGGAGEIHEKHPSG